MKNKNEAVNAGVTKHVKRRLIVHFGLRFILAGVFLTICTVFIFIWMSSKIQEIELHRDFSQAGLLKLGQSLNVVEGTPYFDEQLLERVKSEGGWLQLLQEDGKVIYSLYTPHDLPDAYKAGELISYWKKNIYYPYPYELYLWVKEIDGVMFTLLYGIEPEAKRVLRKLNEIDHSNPHSIVLSNELMSQLKQANLQVQLLDPEGREIKSFNKFDASIPSEYTLSALALRSFYSDRYNARLTFDYNERTQTTWVVTAPFVVNESALSLWKTGNGVMFTALAVLLVTSILLFSVLSIWYANRFGAPVLHIVTWLQHLGSGNFNEPKDRKARSPSHASNGKLRRQFHLFSNVIVSLKHLSQTLRQNEELGRQLETTREEWITGVSHDLKTPLSSIKGYSHMLEAENYSWSEEEVREFSGIIREKASYMEALIDDLSLTYRLKNKALPLDLRETNVDEMLQAIINRFRKNPQYEEVDLQLHRSNQFHFYRLDTRWMSRAIENLLTNAFIHNPSGTRVDVRAVYEDLNEGTGITIEIKDNGIGMDEETTSQLFDRYYRGTSTMDDNAGSGLGMAIARQIIIAHGGDIVIKSELHEGTVVSIKLLGQ